MEECMAKMYRNSCSQFLLPFSFLSNISEKNDHFWLSGAFAYYSSWYEQVCLRSESSMFFSLLILSYVFFKCTAILSTQLHNKGLIFWDSEQPQLHMTSVGVAGTQTLCKISTFVCQVGKPKLYSHFWKFNYTLQYLHFTLEKNCFHYFRPFRHVIPITAFNFRSHESGKFIPWYLTILNTNQLFIALISSFLTYYS